MTAVGAPAANVGAPSVAVGAPGVTTAATFLRITPTAQNRIHKLGEY